MRLTRDVRGLLLMFSLLYVPALARAQETQQVKVADSMPFHEGKPFIVTLERAQEFGVSNQKPHCLYIDDLTHETVFWPFKSDKRQPYDKTLTLVFEAKLPSPRPETKDPYTKGKMHRGRIVIWLEPGRDQTPQPTPAIPVIQTTVDPS